MSCVRVVAMVGLLVVGNAHAAESVFRCEGKDGRITYSDSACPSDSRAVRKLEDAPPVSVGTSKAVARDAREAGQIAQSRNGKADAAQENRQLDEQADASRRECFDLSRRVEYAKRDFEGASPNLRSTAELALRRAQDQHALLCGRK